MQLLKKTSHQTRPVDSTSSDQIRKLTIFMAWFFVATVCALISAATPAEVQNFTMKQAQLRDLENQVWMVDPAELAKLEGKVTRLIQEDPHSPFAHYLLGHLYLRQFKHEPADMGKLRKSSELAQQAIDLDERSEYGYLISAAILDMMGYSDNASQMVNPAVNTKISESWRTLFVRAQLMAGRDSPQLTLDSISAAMAMEPSANPLIAPYVVALIRSEFAGTVIIDSLKDWHKKFPDEVFLQGLAVAYGEANEYQKAVEIYQHMTQLYPLNLDAQINHGILAYVYLNQYQKGLNLLEKSLEHPSMTDQDKRNLVKSHLARIYLKQGETTKARRLFREAISRSEGSQEWLNFSQQTYRQENQYEELANLLDELKEDIPGSDSLYALHGKVMSEYLNQHDQAVKAYNDAILLEPEKIEYHNGLGLAYYRQKDMSRALATFTRAIKIDPRDATIRYNEACILSLLGRTHEAIGSLREALSLDPRLLQTAQQDEDFKNIRSLKPFVELVGEAPAQLTQFP